MNAATRQELIEFIDAVETLALAVSSVAGTNAYSEIMIQGEELKEALKSDETIL